MPGPLKTMRACVNCGQPYRPNNWLQQYCTLCGKKHRDEYMRQYLVGYNELHHDEIRTRKNQRRREIRDGAPLLRLSHPRVNPKDPRICLRCGNDYIPTAPNQKFCAPCGPRAFAEIARASARAYRRNNLELVKQKAADWRKRHKNDEVFHAKKRLRSRIYNARVRRIVLSYYSGGRLVCVCCGETEADFLTIDHVKNNGAEERRSLGGRSIGGVWFYKRLIKLGYPSGYQTLCFDCNGSKGKHRECIHKKKVFTPNRGTVTLDRWIIYPIKIEPEKPVVSSHGVTQTSSYTKPSLAKVSNTQSLLSVTHEPLTKQHSYVHG